MNQEHDKEFVEYVVRAIVDNPDKVVVSRKVDEMGVLLELGVDPSDMGKIIGKDGRTAKAIRTLLRVLGAQSQARINLKIMEPEGGMRSPEAAMETPVMADMPETTSMDDLREISEE
ncbi:MAG: KH domain-containing protein [Patescibacteria group bacterium]